MDPSYFELKATQIEPNNPDHLAVWPTRANRKPQNWVWIFPGFDYFEKCICVL